MPDLAHQPPPQLSSDGRWWWNGYQWVPAKATSSERPEVRRSGRMAFLALVSGVLPLEVAVALIFGTQAGTEGWEKFGQAAIIITSAVCAAPGLVLGILALAFPGHAHDLRRRRIMASIGIGLALLGSIAVFFTMHWINSFIMSLRDGNSYALCP